MKKTTLLTVAIAVLIVLNLTVLAVVYSGAPEAHGPHKQPREVIIERLQFDAGQVEEYQKLIDWHRGEIHRLDSSIRKDKEALYNLLGKKVDNSKKDSLIANINNYQKQVEETHFKHFEDIRGLCRPDQQPYFDALAAELPRLFGPKPPGPGHP